MTNVHEIIDGHDALFPVQDAWLIMAEPGDLAEAITLEYADEDLQRLADIAANTAKKVALDQTGEAYLSPHVKNAAETAGKLPRNMR